MLFEYILECAYSITKLRGIASFRVSWLVIGYHTRPIRAGSGHVDALIYVRSWKENLQIRKLCALFFIEINPYLRITNIRQKQYFFMKKWHAGLTRLLGNGRLVCEHVNAYMEWWMYRWMNGRTEGWWNG